MVKKFLILLTAFILSLCIFSAAHANESVTVKDFVGGNHFLTYKSIDYNSGVLLVDYGPIYFHFKDKLKFVRDLDKSTWSNAKSEADLELMSTETVNNGDYFFKYELLRGVNRTHLYMYRIFINGVADDIYLQLSRKDVVKLINMLMK